MDKPWVNFHNLIKFIFLDISNETVHVFLRYYKWAFIVFSAKCRNQVLLRSQLFICNLKCAKTKTRTLKMPKEVMNRESFLLVIVYNFHYTCIISAKFLEIVQGVTKTQAATSTVHVKIFRKVLTYAASLSIYGGYNIFNMKHRH